MNLKKKILFNRKGEYVKGYLEKDVDLAVAELKKKIKNASLFEHQVKEVIKIIDEEFGEEVKK